MQHLMRNALIDEPYHGKTRPRQKSWKEVREIRDRLTKGESPEEIADSAGCSIQSIIAINRNTNFYDPGWKPVQQRLKYSHVKLTKQNVKDIKQQIREGVSMDRIAVRFRVARQTIINIKNGSSWKNID